MSSSAGVHTHTHTHTHTHSVMPFNDFSISIQRHNIQVCLTVLETNGYNLEGVSYKGVWVPAVHEAYSAYVSLMYVAVCTHTHTHTHVLAHTWGHPPSPLDIHTFTL